jgi:DNA-binding transcriptional LysR family regulator
MRQTTRDIDPNDLLVFARVAELGSFSRAAERLRLPKSTVSRRLASLEARLGERLLLRTTRRQTLTEFGQLLLEHARQVVAEVDAVAALGEHRRAAPGGRLRVSMPSDIATLLLAEPLAAFVVRHPGIALEIDVSPRRVDLLGEGVDVALRMGELDDDRLLAARRLAEFPAGLYASPAYLAARGEPDAPDALAGHDGLRLLQGNGEPAPWTLLRGQERWVQVPAGRTSANLPELLLRLARAGAGISALPDRFAAADVHAGRLRRVLPEWCLPSVTAWALFPGRALMPAKTRAFIDMLVQALDGAGTPTPA